MNEIHENLKADNKVRLLLGGRRKGISADWDGRDVPVRNNQFRLAAAVLREGC